MKLDFDAWTRLASENPREFARLRELVLRRVIDEAPLEHRERLTELQSRIDAQRAVARAPHDPVRPTSSLTWTGLFRLRRELSRPDTRVEQAAVSSPESAQAKSAMVIPLRPSRKARRIGHPGE